MNLDQVDRVEFVVPLPPDQVEARLREATLQTPLAGVAPNVAILSSKPFVGTAGGGRFSCSRAAGSAGPSGP